MCVCVTPPAPAKPQTMSLLRFGEGEGGGLGGWLGVFYCKKFPSPFLSLARFGQRCVGATERGRKRKREAGRERKTV